MRNIEIIRKISLFALVFIIIVYSIFQTQKIIRGPVVKVINPKNGSTFSQALITIDGTAKNVAYLKLNDRPIFTDKNGYFNEKFLLSPGENHLKIEGQDKFKKSTVKNITVVLKEY